MGNLSEHSKIAVYDLGGGTFDLSILELNGGVFQVLSTNGNTRLGGDDLDKRLLDFLVEKIKAAGGPDPAGDLPMLSRIRETAEAAKIRLSTEESAEIALPFLTPDFIFISPWPAPNWRTSPATSSPAPASIACARSPTRNSNPRTSIKSSSSAARPRMPLVRRMVSEIFGCAEFEETRGDLRLGADYHRPAGPRLNTSQNPDEAVALGAAIQAGILSGGFKNMLLLDVTPLSLGMETFGGLMNVIIPRNSTIPVKAGEMFTTAVDYQASMLIHVLQGERERARDNWSLGRFDLEFERAPKGVPRVGVQFEIDANGILHVLARDTKTGRQKIVEMKSAVDVADAAGAKNGGRIRRARLRRPAGAPMDRSQAARRRKPWPPPARPWRNAPVKLSRITKPKWKPPPKPWPNSAAEQGEPAVLKAALAALDEAAQAPGRPAEPPR